MKLMTFPEPSTSSKNQSWNDKVHYCQQWKYLFQNYNYFRFYRPLCRKTLSHKSGELFLDMLHAGFYTLILDIAKIVKRPKTTVQEAKRLKGPNHWNDKIPTQKWTSHNAVHSKFQNFIDSVEISNACKIFIYKHAVFFSSRCSSGNNMLRTYVPF